AAIGRMFFISERQGAGQTMKLRNNFLSAAAMTATSEAMVMGVKAGLDPRIMLDVINSGTGRNTATEDKFGRVVLPRTFDLGFAVGLMTKDLKLCLGEGKTLGVPMQVAEAVTRVLQMACDENGPDKDLTTVVQPLDFYVWAIVGPSGPIIVDTGFDAAMGRKRQREMIKPVGEGLKAVGIEPTQVKTVIISHMHYDHIGNYDLFPRARYHLQDCEMAYATGRCMCHMALRLPFEVDDVVAMVRKVFEGRVTFHDGEDEVAPGITVHHIGGHSKGLQSVRVKTRCGPVVLAADAAHLYAHM